MKRGLSDQVKNDDDGNRNQRPRLFTTWWPTDEGFLQGYGDELENVVRKVSPEHKIQQDLPLLFVKLSSPFYIHAISSVCFRLPLFARPSAKVCEELDQALQRHFSSILRCSPNQTHQTEPRKYKLKLVGNLPGKFFTDNKIEAEGSSSIQVELLDATSGHIIKDGSLSSLKVEIVVLQGHFKVEQLEFWTKKQFDGNIVPIRDGKGPLLVGEPVITLHNGIGLIHKIKFTDNSSWVPSKMFRLGARVNNRKDDIVMEAVSNAFKVMHKRGETDRKRETPSLEDEVWRLRGIAKKGKIYERLAEHQIHKVKDFVRQFHINHNLLQKILGVSGKQLKVIVEQASCSLSSIIYTNPSELSPNDVPADQPIISTSVIPTLHQQQVYAPNPDETAIAMPCDDATNQIIHQLHESAPVNQVQMTQAQSAIMDNNFIIDSRLSEPYDDGLSYTLHSPWNPSSSTGQLFEQPNMFDVPASNWFAANASLVDSTRNSQFEPFDPMDTNVAGSSGSSQAKSKAGWSKVRSVWRILIKHDDATLRKGKFPYPC